MFYQREHYMYFLQSSATSNILSFYDLWQALLQFRTKVRCTYTKVGLKHQFHAIHGVLICAISGRVIDIIKIGFGSNGSLKRAHSLHNLFLPSKKKKKKKEVNCTEV